MTSLLETYNKYFDRGLDNKAEALIPEVIDFRNTIKTIDYDFGMEMEASMS